MRDCRCPFGLEDRVVGWISCHGRRTVLWRLERLRLDSGVKRY